MKSFGIVKRLSAAMLIASLVFCMFNFTVACGNDDENTPAYTFPEVSDTLIDGAYFITDAGFEVYKRRNPEYTGTRSHFFIPIQNNKLWLNEYNRLFVLSYQNGIYIGKINGMNENYDIKVAIKGNLLYIDGWYGIGQYKLDTSYEVSNDIVQKLEPPKDYIIKINDIRKPVVYFKWHLTSGYYGVGELKPAKENNYTIFRFGIQGIGKMSIYFTFDELMTGSNIMKIYIVGGPVINWDKKLLYSTQDSPCLLYEVYVYEDNTVTVT